MHIDDITEAIKRNDQSAIENAFRALVGWPTGERILWSNLYTRKAALGRVCDALATNDRLMPRETVEALQAAGEGLTSLTYSAGAEHAKENRKHFNVVLERGVR